MGKPAARLGDMHICPMQTPAVVPIPHVGGPVMGPGIPTVLIGGIPASVVGDMCTCVGPPDSILMGSMVVLIGGKPAARMGDTTAHGGTIALGCPTVLIGDGGGGGAGSTAAKKDALNKSSLKNAADKGDGLAPRSDKQDLKAQFTLVDEAEKPVSNVQYEITEPNGTVHRGKTDGSGQTQNISGTLPEECTVTFFNN